mmetsp:Transcript_9195/g.29216  ORF Transcript_9195/g.29216 Transcript_9195/m.29216 type:complete len:1134 (+) Transcript_9195:344-3745(+)
MRTHSTTFVQARDTLLMASVCNELRFAAHWEVAILLVPLDPDITFMDYLRLCRHVENACNSRVNNGSAEKTAGHSCRLDQLVSRTSWQDWLSQLRSIDFVGWEQCSWEASSMNYRLVRSTECNADFDKTAAEGFRCPRGVLGLRTSGRTTAGDQEIALQAAMECGSDARCCVTSIYSVSDTSPVAALDKLLLNLFHSLYTEVFCLAREVSQSANDANAKGLVDNFFDRTYAHSMPYSGAPLSHKAAESLDRRAKVVQYDSPETLQMPVPPASHQMVCAAKRLAPRWGRPTSTSISEKARQCKVLADLALLVAANRDAAKYAALAADQLRGSCHIEWYASALVTWCAAVISDPDTNSQTLKLQSFALVNCQTRPLLQKNGYVEDDGEMWKQNAVAADLKTYLQVCKQVSRVSAHVLQVLRKQRQLTPCALELCFKLATWVMKLGDMSGLAEVLSATVAIASDSALRAIECARVAQAVAVIFSRAGLWRKAAHHASSSAQELTKLQNWNASLCVAVQAECALWGLPKRRKLGWLVVRSSAAKLTLRLVRKQRDQHMIVLTIARILAVHAHTHAMQNETTYFGRSAPGCTRCISNVGSRASKSTTLAISERVWLEAFETALAVLPDDYGRWCAVTLQPHLAQTSMHVAELNCLEDTLRNGHWEVTEFPFDLRTPRRVAQALFFNPFKVRQTDKHAEKQEQTKLCEVGECVAVLVTICNDLHAMLHIHTAKLSCVGLRCVCHERSWRDGAKGSSCGSARDQACTLYFTPLEAGVLEIAGIELRTSVYVTTARMSLKETYHALVTNSAHGEVQLRVVQSSMSKNHCAETMLFLVSRTQGMVSCSRSCLDSLNDGIAASIRVSEPQPQFTSSLSFAPFAAEQLGTFAHMQPKPAQAKLSRTGERLALALTFVRTSEVTPKYVRLRAERRQASVSCQDLFLFRSDAQKGLVLQKGTSANDAIVLDIHPSSSICTMSRSSYSKLKSSFIECLSFSTVIMELTSSNPGADGQFELAYSRTPSLNRKRIFPFKTHPSPGVTVTSATFGGLDKTQCDVCLCLRNESDTPVLVAHGKYAALIPARSEHCTLVLALSTQPDCQDRACLAQKVLGQVCWRIDGSVNGAHDGFGQLQLPTCTNVLRDS